MPDPARPSAARRARFSPLDYRDPSPLPWLIHALGPVNGAFLRAGLHLRPLELPDADRARFAAAVNPGTIAFLGPNHPEFMTDWLIDKELSRRVSPLMAHWASYEIVNMHPTVQAFWLANNLISNAPGGRGREYSLAWAARGHGVLLHPEGTASWQADRVGPLVPGIVDMACEAAHEAEARGDGRPVHIVPIVWKLHFTRDVGRELSREMAGMEARMGLPSERGTRVERRFAAMHERLLERACERWGVPRPAGAYFDAQARVAAALLEPVFERYGRPEGDDRRVLHTLRRATRERMHDAPDQCREDRQRLLEVERLQGFDPALYGGPTWTQEHMAECLKRIRTKRPGQGWREALHGVVPVAVAPRRVHVRVPEPFRVRDEIATGDTPDARARLLAALRNRLQRTLDGILADIAPAVDPYRRPNPLAG